MAEMWLLSCPKCHAKASLAVAAGDHPRFSERRCISCQYPLCCTDLVGRENAEVARLLSERDRLIARNTERPAKRNETRIWNINLRLAELASANVHQ